MNDKAIRKPKGTVSTCIAWVFMILQILLIVGALFAGLSPTQGPDVSFHDTPAIVQSVVYLFCGNILGIGALTLSLIVWLRHNNLNGKITAIAAIIVIIVNTSLLSR